ncbi:FAD-binding oxidoreductase [Erwinia endophytica]|uniref:NAD(P)/FAD-dependent oxidoreductase n=1 Tax=Erwinia endophytica TaxID=1563158 RepID=UPI001265EC37|nr:FAD-binding oxidoreductase [Erwinia endophytica]KAB8312548.1 FAD-binding oxidoreductase [Erwinia endophytica]
MSATASSKKIAVIGAGVMGVSIATHLQRQGAEVRLITETEPASGASSHSLAWLNSAGERSLAYHALRMAGIDRYRTLFARHPECEWLRFDGGLYWGKDDASGTLARHTYETSLGYDSHLTHAATVDNFTPNIAHQAIADSAIFNPGEGWVSLPHLIRFLLQEFTSGGGKLVTQAGKAQVITDAAGIATGVSTAKAGNFSADSVVVACGPYTPEVVEPLGVTLPNGSPVAMLVTTEPVEHGLKAVLNTPRAAVRPNPGNSLVMDHDWYESQFTQDAQGNYQIPPAVISELLAESAKLLAGQPTLKAAGYRAGLKPIPGDGDPVLGELAKVPGCFVAFTHSGATLALIVGELLAGEILSGEKHPMLAAFRAERF